MASFASGVCVLDMQNLREFVLAIKLDDAVVKQTLCRTEGKGYDEYECIGRLISVINDHCYLE